MNIGFTGTRRGLTEHQCNTVVQLLEELSDLDELFQQFHHGGAVGADTDADGIAHTLHYDIVVHPCPGVSAELTTGGFNGHVVKWEEVLPPLVRNRRIVDAVDLLIAAPRLRREELRSGTWATIRYARKVGVPTVMVWP